MSTAHDDPKPLLWVGSAKKDLLAMPGEVMDLVRDRLKAALMHAGQ
ncbi:MAG TPA: hypothetical protein VIK56_12600 [Rhodoferax sp.]